MFATVQYCPSSEALPGRIAIYFADCSPVSTVIMPSDALLSSTVIEAGENQSVQLLLIHTTAPLR